MRFDMKRYINFLYILLLFIFSVTIKAQDPFNPGPIIQPPGGGGGSGDMTKAVYDTNGDGTVDSADEATAAASQAITDNAIVTIDDADAADNDYAKLTANGLEGRSYSEVKEDLNLEIGTDVPAQSTTVEFSTQTDSGLTGASDTVTLTAEYKENHRLLLSSDTDNTALTFAETDSGASAITDQTHIYFINTGSNTLTFTGSSGVQEGNYSEYEQYNTGECIYVTDRWVCWPTNVTTEFFSSIPTWSYAHFANANHPYSDTTTPHVLITTETKGGIITNCGATEDRVYTLHAYDDGMNFMVQVCAAYQMDLEPPSGGVINLNGTDAAADEHIINAADTPYDAPLSCRSIEISDDTYKLMCNSSNTDWAEATP